MDAIGNIPVIGVIWQLIGYLVAAYSNPTVSVQTLFFAAPLILGAMCGIMNERSGVVNIGIEGMMLMSAFFGFIGAGFAAQALPSDPWPIFGITIPLLVGVLVAVITGMLVSALHAWLAISIRADQIISGTIINIAAAGLTGYLHRLIITPNPNLGGAIFAAWEPPASVLQVPVVGWAVNTLFHHGPIAITSLIVVVILQVLLFRSRWGLRTRAVGEHPKAAETVGIDVIRLRYRNVILGGIFAGLAGAFLTLESQGHFQLGLTAGRGFIALAAVIIGRWTPVGALLAAILFGATESLRIAIGVAPPTGDLAGVLGVIPEQFYGALPYIVTIIVLAGFVGRSTPPAAVGQPYLREART
jgi:simple sugar transport system permease protein